MNHDCDIRISEFIFSAIKTQKKISFKSQSKKYLDSIDREYEECDGLNLARELTSMKIPVRMENLQCDAMISTGGEASSWEQSMIEIQKRCQKYQKFEKETVFCHLTLAPENFEILSLFSNDIQFQVYIDDDACLEMPAPLLYDVFIQGPLVLKVQEQTIGEWFPSPLVKMISSYSGTVDRESWQTNVIFLKGLFVMPKNSDYRTKGINKKRTANQAGLDQQLVGFKRLKTDKFSTLQCFCTPQDNEKSYTFTSIHGATLETLKWDTSDEYWGNAVDIQDQERIWNQMWSDLGIQVYQKRISDYVQFVQTEFKILQQIFRSTMIAADNIRYEYSINNQGHLVPSWFVHKYGKCRNVLKNIVE